MMFLNLSLAKPQHEHEHGICSGLKTDLKTSKNWFKNAHGICSGLKTGLKTSKNWFKNQQNCCRPTWHQKPAKLLSSYLPVSPSRVLRAPGTSPYHLVPKHLRTTWSRPEQSHLLPEACSPNGTDISGTPCPRHFTVPFGAEAPSDHVVQAWAIPPPSWGLLSQWHRQETTTPETNGASSART